MWRRTRSLLVCVVVVAGLWSGAGCSSECQRLCTAWYDYQRDTCGAVNTDDERVTCISDYRRSRTSGDELIDCGTRILEVRAMRSDRDASCCTWDLQIASRILEVRAMRSDRDASCCTWDLQTCPTRQADDDDSAATAR